MIKVVAAAIACVLLLLGACEQKDGVVASTLDAQPDLAPLDTQANRATLIGTWYASHPRSDGSTIRSIAQLNADSSFVIEFEIIQPDGSVVVWSEFGIWGVSGDIHFTVTRGVEHDGQMTGSDPEDAANYLAYKILTLTHSEFEYQTVVTGNVFRSEKVASTFEFPKIVD